MLSNTDNESNWYVPVSYTTSEDEDKFESTSPAVWLTPENEATIEISENASWVIVNNKETGMRAEYNKFVQGVYFVFPDYA